MLWGGLQAVSRSFSSPRHHSFSFREAINIENQPRWKGASKIDQTARYAGYCRRKKVDCSAFFILLKLVGSDGLWFVIKGVRFGCISVKVVG